MARRLGDFRSKKTRGRRSSWSRKKGRRSRSRQEDQMIPQCKQTLGKEDDRDERRRPRGAGRGRKRSVSVAT
eukprot:4376527-Heterocapsa_arctica.AAC.1